MLRLWVAWALLWIGRGPRKVSCKVSYFDLFYYFDLLWKLRWYKSSLIYFNGFKCIVWSACVVCPLRFAFVLLILVMVFVVQFIIEARHDVVMCCRCTLIYWYKRVRITSITSHRCRHTSQISGASPSITISTTLSSTWSHQFHPILQLHGPEFQELQELYQSWRTYFFVRSWAKAKKLAT